MLCRAFRYEVTGAIALSLVATSLQAAPVPLVDTKSSSTAANLTREQLDSLPIGRRLEDLVRTCPGNTIPTISRNPGVLIDGKPAIDLNCVQPADIEMVEVFKVHNSLRAEYGAPPLVWDPLLIQGPKGAQSHANSLAAAGTLFHSSRDGRGTVRENIGQGLAGASVGQMLGGWTAEKKNFIPGTFPNVSRTHSWYDIGHIAQMLWIQTVTIGCAKAAGIGSWLVCRYNPGGNKDGQLVGIPPERKYAVEQPKLPTTEVFRQPVQSASSDDTRTGRRASLFDLGIYAGGAYSTDWFDVGQSDPVIASTNIDDIGRTLGDILLGGNDPPSLNHDYGFDGTLFVGYDLGAFRLEAEVAYKQADIDAYDTTIRLPGETAQQPVSDNEGLGVEVRYPFGPVTVGSYYVLEEEAPDGEYDVREAFAEIRIPLLRDTPFFEGLDRAGYVYDRFDVGSGYGSTIGTSNQFLAPDLHVPLTQNGSINLAYIWLQSDIATAGGGGASVVSRWNDAIDWTPIEDLLFRSSWAEGFGGPSEKLLDFGGPHTLGYGFDIKKAITDAVFKEFDGSQLYLIGYGTGYGTSATFTDLPVETWGEFSSGIDLANFSKGLPTGNQLSGSDRGEADTKVDQPTLPNAEIFKGAQQPGSQQQGMQGFEWPDLVANVRVDQAWGAAQLSAALHQLEAMSTFVPPAPAEAGYMCQPPSMFDLGIYAGGAYTTEWFTIDDDGALLDTKVEQPTLPSSEVFNPADFKYTCDDVM